MGKTYHDNPSRKKQINIEKSERGEKRRMTPYKRTKWSREEEW